MDALRLHDVGRPDADRVALIAGDTTLDFRALAAAADAACDAVGCDGPGPLVAFEATPTPAAVALALGLLDRGRTFLPLHPKWTEAERARVTSQLGAVRVVVPPLSVATAARAADSRRTAPTALGLDALACVLTTSGSSGDPKGVELTRGALLASAAAHAENVPFEPDDRWLLGLPFSHAGGLSILTRCLFARSTVVLASGFEPRAVLEAVVAERVTLLSVVPTMLAALLDHDRGQLARLRLVLVGGAHFPEELRRRAHAAEVPTLASYGLTETSSQLATQRWAERPHDPSRLDSGVPIAGAAIAIRDAAGRTLGPGEIGRIVVRGPMLFRGYVDRRACEDARPHGDAPLPARPTMEELDTGDLGWRDEAGRLFVVGRADDTLITGGENVHPSEIERAFAGDPDVLAVAAFGVPDARWGQLVCVALVPRAGADARAIVQRVGLGLARFKRPRGLLTLAALPLSAVGKVDRRALAALATERLERL